MRSAAVPGKYFSPKAVRITFRMHCNYHGKAIAQKKIKKIDLQLALDSKY
jgi:hypothetical protein